MLKSDTDQVGDGRVRFGGFTLDCAERQLWQGAVPVALNARYLDALILLVRERGRLVAKDRFMEEVWRGVPVTDEALTQCIRTLRRVLGDDASRPQFIETVPKYGYRFVAAVAPDGPVVGAAPRQASEIMAEGVRGTTGAVLAGVIGGIFYGAAAQGAQMGGASTFLVLWCVTVAMAAIGGAGVAFGAAVVRAIAPPRSGWIIAGAGGGGLIVGALVRLLGMDAFTLLLGLAPGPMTGGAEGAALGGATGLAIWLADRSPASLRRIGAMAAGIGGVAGIAIALAGGRLLGGSLAALASAMPGSRLTLDGVGALLGEGGFGPVSAAVTAGLEGALFVGCITIVIIAIRRRHSAI
ncbi:MAG: transcriptional regulator [Alphaproteobacteria bacterium HGW-Alphaproteobacteria-15]|nr:MAG: transcriptional regulator [Alphaproteobacteria bacterium HGW-Alphaproteobacteria-15]